MTDKEKEKLHRVLSSLWKNDDSVGKMCYNQALQDVQTAIDLQEEPKKCMYSKEDYTDEDRKVLCDGCVKECEFNKKEEPVSEELEEAIEDAMPDANWYIEENNDTTGEDAYNSIQMGNMFRAGAQWRKEKMMAKAVDGTLYSTICGSEQNVVAHVGYGEYGKDGDKVRVIVIKE